MERVLAEDLRVEFAARGLLRLPAFLPRRSVSAALDVLHRSMERRGLWRGGAWVLDRSPVQYPNLGPRLDKGIVNAKPFTDLITPDLSALVRLLAGRETTSMTAASQLLFTWPNATAWTVPHGIWHLDVPRLGHGGVPGVQLFMLLDTVAPGGGGTLVVAGSHRLLNTGERIASRDVKGRLKREPYFKALLSRDERDRLRFVREPGHIGEVEVRVVELCGEPGDVYCMDMRLLHTLAPNTATRPRIVLTRRYLLPEAMGELYAC